VFDPAGLTGGGAGPLSDWLLGRAGPGGIAFGAGAVGVAPAGAGTFEGVVRSVRPTPAGTRVELTVARLPIVARLPPPSDRPGPALGRPLRFDVDPAGLHPLALAPAAPGTPP
jgi:hypothetical protein